MNNNITLVRMSKYRPEIMNHNMTYTYTSYPLIYRKQSYSKKKIGRLLITEINSKCNQSRLPNYSYLDFWTKFVEKYHSAYYRPAFLFKKQHCFHKLIHFFLHYQALGLEAITDQDLLKFHDRELPLSAILDMKK